MALRLEEAQKHFSQLIQSILFHCILPKSAVRKKDTSAPVAGAKVYSLYHPDLPRSGLIGARNAGLRLCYPKQARKWLPVSCTGSFTDLIPLCGTRFCRLVSSSPFIDMILSQSFDLSRKMLVFCLSDDCETLCLSRQVHPDRHHRMTGVLDLFPLFVK